MSTVVDTLPAEEEEDEVTRLQSVDAFNTLEDGQPGPPGQLELLVAAGADHNQADGFGFAGGPEVAFTPSGSAFARALQFTAAVEVEGTRTEFEPALNLGWSQRWLGAGTGGKWVPTIGTLTEVNLPFTGGFGRGLVGDALEETVTVAEELGPGSLYLNGMAAGVLGDDPTQRNVLLGMRAGYQWIVVDEKLALIVDYVHEQAEERGARDQHTAELSLKWTVNDHVTLGPGVRFGVDDNPGTPRFGGGLLLLVE